MDPIETIWIKTEVPDEVATEPSSMVVEDTVGTSWSSDFIEKGLEVDLKVDETVLEDPLHVGEAAPCVKQEPELEHRADDAESNVVTSARYELESTRLIRNSSGSCDVSLEETINERELHNKQEIGARDLTHCTIVSTHTGLTKEQEEENARLFATRPKFNLSEVQFHNSSCSFCLQSFTSKYGLIMHVFRHIPGVRPPKYICKSCGEVFPSRVSLKRHLGMDGPKKRYKCDVCGKSFTHMCDLRPHLLIHSGIRPHKCHTCGRSFTQMGNLNRHILIHAGMRPQKCDICGKSYTHVRHPETHALIHSGVSHKCEVCGKSYNRLCDLKAHVIIHTGIRPYKCDTCGKAFARSYHLKRHALIHTGNRPHKCDICGKSFTQSHHLNGQALIHTGMRPWPIKKLK